MAVAIHRSAPASRGIDARAVRRAAERMLSELDLDHAELSVLLTDDLRIRELNARHRRKNEPTDVLAFPMENAAHYRAKKRPPRLLGDVAISIDTAARQARKGKRTLIAEVTHLLAHGLLHLVGYDHETDAEEREMDEMTNRLVRAAGSVKTRSRKPRADLAK